MMTDRFRHSGYSRLQLLSFLPGGTEAAGSGPEEHPGGGSTATSSWAAERRFPLSSLTCRGRYALATATGGRTAVTRTISSA